MNGFVGWCREKMGRSTHKAVLMVPISQTARVYPEWNPTGGKYSGPTTNKPLKCYEAVKAHYFSLSESLWKIKKTVAYELHPENTSYVRGEAKLQFINKITGAPISFDEVQTTVFTPEALVQAIAAEWVKNAHASVKGLNMGWVMMLVIFGFGVTVGALILMGIQTPQVQNLISPTPTPFPTFIP